MKRSRIKLKQSNGFFRFTFFDLFGYFVLFVVVYGVFFTDLNTCNRFAKEAKSTTTDGILYGFAAPKVIPGQTPYYCVYVGDLEYDQIVDTDYHEMCHIIIEEYPEGKEHFCSSRIDNIKNMISPVTKSFIYSTSLIANQITRDTYQQGVSR